MEDEGRFCVVKYDNLSLEADPDPDRPGRSRSYEDRDVSAPHPLDTKYPTLEDAKNVADSLNKTYGGEIIEITLANGMQYKGPRYTFVVGEVSR